MNGVSDGIIIDLKDYSLVQISYSEFTFSFMFLGSHPNHPCVHPERGQALQCVHPE